MPKLSKCAKMTRFQHEILQKRTDGHGARATTDGRCALSVKSRTAVGYLKSSQVKDMVPWWRGDVKTEIVRNASREPQPATF